MPINPKKISPIIRDMFARVQVGTGPKRLGFVVTEAPSTMLTKPLLAEVSKSGLWGLTH